MLSGDASNPVNIFRAIPVPEDKPKRKLNLHRALANSEELVRSIAAKYFQPQIAAGLTNPMTCMLKVRELMVASSYLEHLSDFVAICVIFVYTNERTRRQAIAFLQNDETRLFPFASNELDAMMRTFIQVPPTNGQDINNCGRIIAQFCGKDEYCATVFPTFLKPDVCTPAQRPLLTATAKALVKTGKDKLSRSDLELVEEFAAGKIESVGNLMMQNEMTPEQRRMHKIQIEHKINRFFDLFQGHKVFWYVMMTIVMLILVLLFVL